MKFKPEDGVFFTKDEFYSTLKGKSISDEEYENSKLLYTKQKIMDVSDLNDLYNAQNVILLCKIFENQFQIMYRKNMYNPRKVNSGSKFSGCIQKEQSKVILDLPTKKNIVETFEKTVTGEFSRLNSRFSFDIELLMPNYSNSDFDKMSIDESYEAFKRDDLKVAYSVKINNEEKPKKRIIISKIIKFDENNQYGFAMTKPDIIKEKPSPTWKAFNLLLESASIDEPTGHLLVVDIKIDYENAIKNNFFLCFLQNIKFWMRMKDLFINF